MPAFAVAAPRDDDADAQAFAPGADPEHLPFWTSAGAALNNTYQVDRLGGREDALNTAFLQRRMDVETRTGEGFGGAPPVIDPDVGGATPVFSADEDRINQLRAKYPTQMAGVLTDQQVRDQVAQRLTAISGLGARAASDHPVASFAGGMGGQLLDPINTSVGALTGGLTETAPLAMRMLIQSGVWGGVAAAEAPGKMGEAGLIGGPAYTGKDALGDIVSGAAGGAGFELAGAAIGGLLKAGWRAGAERFGPQIAEALRGDDAARGAVNVLDRTALDETAIGPDRAGGDYDAAVSSLDTQSPPPPIEPSRDISDLFSQPPAGDLSPVVAQTQPTFAAISQNGASLFERTEYRGRPIYAGQFDPLKLQTAADAFQYKSDGDTAGVTNRLKGVQAWDPASSGKVLIFQDGAGINFIADGHQRLALAKRMDAIGFEPKLDGYMFRGVDGWTPREVRVLAALKNIREGQGAPLDAAKVFRDAPSALNDDSLPVSGDFIAQAKGLARLSPDAFGAVVNKVVPERYAAQIGQLAGDRPDLHGGMVRLLREGAPANLDESHSLIQEALQDDWLKAQGQQSDLFGEGPAMSVAIGRAKLRAYLLRSVRSDARLYAQLVKHADAIEAGGNTLARDANEANLAVTNAAMEMIAKLGLRHGELGEAMNEAAARIAGGEASAGKGVLRTVKGMLARGEGIDGFRGALLDPAGPTAAAEGHLSGFDEPGGEGAKAQISPKPEDAAIEGARLPTAAAEGQPGRGDLWRATPEQLDAMLADKGVSDDDKLLQALGSEAEVKEFKRLDAKQNSMDPRRADEGAREFDAKFGNLTEDQQRLVYGIGETDAQADEIQAVLKAHSDVVAGDPDSWVAYMAALSARRVSVEDMAAVLDGKGSAEAQAAFVRMRAAYQAFEERGIDANEIPHRMANALVDVGGWKPDQAADVVGAFVEDLVGDHHAPEGGGEPLALSAPDAEHLGLFDDLHTPDDAGRALEHLASCVPGE